MQKNLHLIIKGKVQGVWFRQSAKKTALGLGLDGYVRNLDDGNVEIEAQGPEDMLLELLEWCRHGPEYAQVEDIEVKWINSKKKYKDFIVSYNNF